MKHLEINTDYRIELFSLIVFLSELDEKYAVDRSDSEYAISLREKFLQFATHEAVIKLPEIWESGICWDTVPLLLFHLTDEFEFDPNVPIMEYLKSQYEGDFCDVIKYVELVKDFVKKSNFKQFFDSLGTSEYVIKVREKCSELPVLEILEEYINVELPKSDVIVSLQSFSSFGTSIQTKKGRENHCILGAQSLKTAIANNNFDRIALSIIWHEFLHPVINPLTDKLFEEPFNLTDSQVEWYCQVNESIIWAICFRLLLKVGLVTDKSDDWYFSNAERNGAPKLVR